MIRTRPVTREYEEGWALIFGKDAIMEDVPVDIETGERYVDNTLSSPEKEHE